MVGDGAVVVGRGDAAGGGVGAVASEGAAADEGAGGVVAAAGGGGAGEEVVASAAGVELALSRGGGEALGRAAWGGRWRCRSTVL